MKKRIVCVLMSIAVLALGACAQKAASENANAVKEEVKQEAKEKSKEKIELSVFAGSIPENTPTGAGLNAMVEYINEKGGESLKAKAYYDTSLGDATSMVQGLQQGTIDIGVAGTAYFSGLVPEVEIFQLPFLFENLEDARNAVDGEVAGKIFEKFEEKSIVGLSFWENGFRQLSNNVRPVSTPKDLEGIKMRTLPATVQVETWKALGALPTTIDSSELYTALQQGTVNAQENPLHEIVSRKFYEVQNHISLTDHVYTPFMMGMSKKTWDKLDDEQRMIIKEAADIGKDIQRKVTEEKTAEAKQTLLDNGCEIIETPDKEAFKSIAVSSWKVFTDANGTELLDMIQK